jgi:uncharacterized protein (TIGR03437 family)
MTVVRHARAKTLLVILLVSSAAFAQTIIQTVAGGGNPFAGPMSAVSAPLGNLSGVAVDAAGNVFASDPQSRFIVKITPAGILTVLAFVGGGGLVVDPAGNIYVTQGDVVQKITPSGVVTTAVGTGVQGGYGDGGPATSAQLGEVIGVALDPSGNLYLADAGNQTIRKVDTSGIINAFAGLIENGGFSGDGGPATSASLHQPTGIATDASGNVYIADTQNYRIRKVDRSGIITTFAGNGIRGSSGDGGLATSASMIPSGITLDANGNVYIIDSARVRKINTSGIITTVAGTVTGGFSGDGGPATSAQLSSPNGIAVDASGNLYIADFGNSRLRKVSSSGIITTFAGNGYYLASGDGGPAVSALLNAPLGVAVDPAGQIFIADSGSSRVRKVDASGTITTFAGNGQASPTGDGGPATSAAVYAPQGVALDPSGNVYITTAPAIRKVDSGGIITSLTANVSSPRGIAADASGNLYVAEPSSQVVGKISPSGSASTFAGTGTPGFSGDGGLATSAALSFPNGVAWDAAGNVYIADSQNHRIRKVNPAGMITTIAGSSPGGFSGDGGLAVNALLSSPSGVVVDAAGNLYIADLGNNRVRKIDPTGIITTVAGDSFGFSGDGGFAAYAGLEAPYGVAVDTAGNLYIADSGNGRIRKVTFGKAAPAVNSGGITNGASFQAGTVVPGGILSIFGLNFADGPANPSGVPLPTNFDGVQVQINGLAVPFFYVSPTQLNVQAPFELASTGQASIVVQTKNGSSVTQVASLAADQPGIFTLGGSFGNQGAILLGNTNLLAMPTTAGIPSAPVHVGDVVSIFCTGLGATTPAIASNTPASSSPTLQASLASIK